MVFCAYCGKSFTRKEHLERHIPIHTNVKPHRCSACQLSFARRDLLQRHHSTYHEAHPMEPPPGGVPTVAGKTPIACLNCAQAKTGCDKRVPCARCADKNLPCAARFARRSSKAALRAAQASAAMSSQVSLPPQTTSDTPTVNPAFMDMDPATATRQDSPGQPVMTPDGTITIDPRIQHQDSPPKKSSPASSNHLSPENYPSPHARVDGMDDFMQLGNDFMPHDGNYQDMLVWQDYPLSMDMYPSSMSLGRADVPLPTFTDLSDMSSNSEHMSSSRGSIHTRSTSIMSSGDFETTIKTVEMAASSPSEVPEFEVVIAAEAAWPLARCNPPVFSGTCPRTAIVHLESLEQKSKHEGTWDALEKYLEQVDWDAADLASVIPMDSRTRDKMLAITQTFLHKALEIHRGGVNSNSNGRYSSAGMLTFLVLPPPKILEYFLRSYVRSLSFFYSLVSTGCVDPNEMIQNNQASTLLVLLMIAQGASAVPTAEARALAAGLIETCRISLFDIIEKDIEMCADPIALRCALLFTLLGAWSGDKWLMDIAMGQRGMYLSMLRHAGMLESQPSMIPSFQGSTSTELQWRTWLHRETQNRLVYNYVMVDQELSLFHDTAPMLSVSELCAPLPGPELLWMSANAEQWMAGMQSIYGCTANVNAQLLTTPSLTPSLYDIFQDFLHDNLSRRQSSLTPQQLRLLLHPLQSLLCHLRQMLSCFSDLLSTRRTTARTVTKASTMLRLEEVQALLQKWYELSITYHKTNPNCPVSKTNLVLYHLISLNAVTHFPEIERLARREAFDGSYWELGLRYKRCVYQREEAIFHSGQVLRLVRAMPVDRRPCWWSVALYRATLILWTDSVSRLDPNFQKHDSGNPVAIDQVTPEDPALIAYLWNGDGIPVLTHRDGTTANLEKPNDVLSYAAKFIEEGISSRLNDGIRRKIVALGNNWNVDGTVMTTA
ncbi:transcription factor Cmr1 [Pseudomassariella vexata]|uniref:Transcription factor Cmr1 n=1 Tax=Pseudomassariella vexata TaxID=1141098 RepID=A0A1Y2E1C8_9PEZI|nr:transcription factor Cmr1 [Pseudomassariella vexata]ORY65289.1 transcription factor Cmr1 [Pseudomassariella vexata]